MRHIRFPLVLLAAAVIVVLAGGAGAAGNSIESPDTAGNVGLYTSLALDGGGNPVISYYDATNKDLKLMHCNDPNCADGGESIQSPDMAGTVGGYTSLALDDDGNPVVSYYDYGNENLKVMHCNDPDCAGGGESIQSPDTAGKVGLYTSLALDGVGNPVVSYYDDTNDNLKVMHCNDPNCADGGESIQSPDTAGSVGRDTSLALDAGGNPVVSYYDSTNRNLKLLHCNDPNCADGGESIQSPDTAGTVGLHTSLALDGGGNPVVSYVATPPQDLKVMHCNDPNCADGGESITSHETGDVPGESSLVLDCPDFDPNTRRCISSSGNPVVSYGIVHPYDVHVMHCNDPNCSGGDESIQSPDTAGWVGDYISLALDDDGNPVVSYYDFANDDLKLLHCGDPNCSGQPGGNTVPHPEGPNKEVDLGSGVKLTCANVPQGGGGESTLKTGISGAKEPFYQVVPGLGDILYYDISTTANCEPPITICIKYDHTKLISAETALRLRKHISANNWKDVTKLSTPQEPNPDTVNHIICGEVDSLSVFAMMEPGPVGGIVNITADSGSPAEASGGSGADYALLAAALAAGAVITLAAGGWYARRRVR